MAKPIEKKAMSVRLKLTHIEKLKQLSEQEERPVQWFIDAALEAYLKDKETAE
ncbi:hypothetical protein [Enterovibrio calviensis]|uniref:hypothetical protein n=1 Tax=Enterovibrio calviensis TaxID=91359 RepID=UPI000A861E59|nr:hypothetical protein [Enterovibrio calviensis]